MKFFCNGFNLYKKFKTNEPLIETFKAFNYEDVNDLEVSLTFAVMKTKNNELYHTGGNYIEEQRIDYNFGIIVRLSCTNDDLFVLNKEGRLFQIHIADFQKVKEITDKKSLEKDDKFVHIAIGDRLKVGLTKFGYIYDSLRKVNFDIHSTVVDIKTGGVHCLILDSQGNLYSFGGGSRGQLGQSSLEDESDPKQIEALAGIKIVAIACGTWHCAVISNEGDLYTWGWNQNGQLGLPMNNPNNNTNGFSVMACPHVVDFPDENANVVKVACGKRHTIALLASGELYGCGMNKYKQLRAENSENIEMMTMLHDFSDETVTEIKCGPWNSIVCCN